MKKKQNIIFVCKNCGTDSPKWLGKCPSCGRWNSFIEKKETQVSAGAERRMVKFSSGPVTLASVPGSPSARRLTGIGEFDRILGGGITASSLILLGGPPGIGKSTLMLQVAARMVGAAPVLYVSGEESLEQIKSRAVRIGLSGTGNLFFMSETNLEKIISEAETSMPGVLVIDSIQTVYKDSVTGSPGSVSQVRECAGELLNLAKGKNITVFLLGHVTKEGDIAGPNILEHMVDTVLYFDSEKSHSYRILRTYKNRFGATNEIGVFEMKPEGLAEVTNPSALFLSERAQGIPGSAVTTAMEGTRPLLVEVQALVSRSGFAAPRRVATGIDYNRTILLVSILENRSGLGLESCDVFVNAAGGAKLKEPACDLAVCCAVFSAFAKKPVEKDAVFIGEVGLGGEIRGVGFIEERIKESEKLGFRKIYIPKANAVSAARGKGKSEIIAAEKVSEVLEMIKKYNWEAGG